MTNAELEKIWPHDEALWGELARRSPTVILAFSRGKDSVALWLALRRWGGFKKVVPVHYYLCWPHLSFVAESLRYFEEFFGEKIYDLPHPSLYRMLRHLVFQAPENVAIIRAAKLPEFEYGDLLRCFRSDYNLPADAMLLKGVRACDSIIRRGTIQTYGPIRKDNAAEPIWNWNKARTLKIIADSRCKLPADYDLFGRSFDGIDARFTAPLKKHRPADFAALSQLFPLIEADIFRTEQIHD